METPAKLHTAIHRSVVDMTMHNSVFSRVRVPGTNTWKNPLAIDGSLNVKEYSCGGSGWILWWQEVAVLFH